MKPAAPNNKPDLLMVSHCVPDAVGSHDRARAWQLLRLLACAHRVHLACVFDGPVHLSQWRAIDAITERLAIEVTPIRRSVLGRLTTPIDRAARRRARLTGALTDPINAWKAETRYRTIVVTDASLRPLTERTRAATRVLDLNPNRPTGPGALRTADNWDLVTVGRQEYFHSLSNIAGRIVMLPDAVDLAYLSSDGTTGGGEDDRLPPNLVIHSDWANRDSRRSCQWFRDRVWPRVRQAVPDARIGHTGPGVSADTLTTLRSARVVVAPGLDPHARSLPILQAMALKRAVVTSEDATADLGARHGEHLLASASDDDWATQCTEALRSASLRLKLARGSRTFVEQHYPFERAGRPLIRAMAVGLRGRAKTRAA